MIDLFRKETELCRSAIDPKLKKEYPIKLIRYVGRRFEQYGYNDRFEPR